MLAWCSGSELSKLIRNRLETVEYHGYSDFSWTLLPYIAAIVILTAIPYLHIGVFYFIFWSSEKEQVDKERCTCECFDTVFRGHYETPPSSYKHVYFNCTSNTLKIWILIVLGILALNESLSRIAAAIRCRRMRMRMFILFLSSIYPHYYGWWGFFGYLNEEYYLQWNHQMFFSLTEALSTLVVIHLCNSDNRIRPWKLLVIISINMTHIIIGCIDQFIDNLIYHQGEQFQEVRDVGLIIPDILHLVIAYLELLSLADSMKLRIYRLFSRIELFLSTLSIMFFSWMGKHL